MSEIMIQPNELIIEWFEKKERCEWNFFIFCLLASVKLAVVCPIIVTDFLFLFFFFVFWLLTDKNELLAAKTYLEQAAATNLPEFLKALSDVLVNTSYSPVARTAAGLQLKNHLTSKDADVAQEYRNRWLSVPEMIREYIKKNVSCPDADFDFVNYLLFLYHML